MSFHVQIQREPDQTDSEAGPSVNSGTKSSTPDSTIATELVRGPGSADQQSHHQLGDVVVICKCNRRVQRGVMIQCGTCLRWGHSRCYAIADDEDLWGAWLCHLCPVVQHKRGSSRSGANKQVGASVHSATASPQQDSPADMESPASAGPLPAPSTSTTTPTPTKKRRLVFALPSLDELGPDKLRYAPGHEPTNSATGRPVRERRTRAQQGETRLSGSATAAAVVATTRATPAQKARLDRLEDDDDSSALSSAHGSSSQDEALSDDNDSDDFYDEEIPSAVAANHVRLEHWLNYACPGLGVSAAPVLMKLGITHHAQFARFRTLEWWEDFFDQEIAGRSGLTPDEECVVPPSFTLYHVTVNPADEVGLLLGGSQKTT